MGQAKTYLVLSLKLSDKNFEKLFNRNPIDVHIESIEKKNQSICLKELSHCTVWYHALWQDQVVKKMESPNDFLRYYYMEQFEFHAEPVKPKKLFYKIFFLIQAKEKVLTKFLKWFRKFMLDRKIPLEKADGFRAIINIPENVLGEEELKKLHCWKIKNDNTKYAVIYSTAQHKETLALCKKLNLQKEIKMKKEKELKAKKNQEDWDAETEEVMKKRKKSSNNEEKRSKLKEKLTKKEKKDDANGNRAVKSQKKKGRKVRKNESEVVESKKGRKAKSVKKEKTINPIEVATKNLSVYLKENLGEGVVTVSEKDVAKAFKEMPKGMMKKLAKAFEEKFNVQSEKTDTGVVLTIWKKAKKIPAKVFKAAA